MPITIHLVRHAQGYHNVHHDVSIPDPYLTPLGLKQSKSLGANFPDKDKITHIVASPMKRTLHTAYYAFQDLIDGPNGKKIIANPLLQECNEWPCDVGSEPEALVSEFGAHADLALVVKGWNVKTSGSVYAADDAALEQRARAARTWLRMLGKSQENAIMVVVSHGDFIKYLTQTCKWEKKSNVSPVLTSNSPPYPLQVDEEKHVLTRYQSGISLGKCRVPHLRVYQPRRK